MAGSMSAANQASSIAFLVVISFTLIGGLLVLEGRIGFNPADEGFLWHGVEAVSAGEVPVRDFQSYFPGRYYWSMLWGHALGPGMISLRLSNAIFQGIGLFFGLLAVSRFVSRKADLIMIAMLLTVWMFPRHKLFEPALTMMAIYVGARFIDSPSGRNCTLCGIFTGVAALFGPNHGLYVSASLFSIILIVHFRTGCGGLRRSLFFFGSGIVPGFSPMLLVSLLIPGFFGAVWESVTSVFRIGTNIPLPTPWPWVTIPKLAAAPDHEILHVIFELAGSMCFLIMPALFTTSIVAALYAAPRFLSENSVLVSCALVGFFYQHHAFSRPDMGHLAQALPPLIIGAVAVPRAIGIDGRTWVRPAGIALICFGIVSGLWAHDYVHYVRARQSGNDYEEILAGRDTLLAPREQARLVRNVSEIVSAESKNSGDILLAPHWPGFYPLLGRKSPVRETYFLHKSTDEHQRDLIQELKGADLKGAIIGDIALDGRDDLRFRNTHPLVWAFILENFRMIPTDRIPENYRLFRPNPQGCPQR